MPGEPLQFWRGEISVRTQAGRCELGDARSVARLSSSSRHTTSLHGGIARRWALCMRVTGGGACLRRANHRFALVGQTGDRRVHPTAPHDARRALREPRFERVAPDFLGVMFDPTRLADKFGGAHGWPGPRALPSRVHRSAPWWRSVLLIDGEKQRHGSKLRGTGSRAKQMAGSLGQALHRDAIVAEDVRLGYQ